jgi:hypothetical protein
VKISYVVTLKVANRETLADIIDAIGNKAQSIEIELVEAAPKVVVAPSNAAPKTVKSRRGPKRSKVNDAIRTALAAGTASISDLKEGLVRAGMSPASLSTGIAALTKAGEIERVGDGVYGLKAA